MNNHVIDVALGNAAADMVIKNGKLLFGFHKDKYLFHKYDIYRLKYLCNRCYTDTG